MNTGSQLRRRLLVFLVALLAPVRAAGLEEKVCPNGHVTNDDLYWPFADCWDEFEDWFVEYFNFGEKQWNEGWGWGSCNITQAFPKMFNAAHLLTYGIDETERFWSANRVELPITGGPQLSNHPSTPALVTVDGSPHVFIRNERGALIYAQRSSSGSWTAVNLSTSLSADGTSGTFDGTVHVVDSTPGDFTVLGLPEAGYPVLFEQQAAGSWKHRRLIQPAATGSSNIMKHPSFYLGPAGEAHVFGFNDAGELLHLSRITDWASWQFENATQANASLAAFPGTGRPAIAHAGSLGTIAAFARGPLGQVVMYRRSSFSGWSVTDLSQTLGITEALVSSPSGNPTLVALEREGGNIQLFMPTTQGHLFHLQYHSSLFSSSWRLRQLPNPASAPFQLAAFESVNHDVHLLATTTANLRFLHYRLTPGASQNWKLVDIESLADFDAQVTGRPAVTALTGSWLEGGAFFAYLTDFSGRPIEYVMVNTTPVAWGALVVAPHNASSLTLAGRLRNVDAVFDVSEKRFVAAASDDDKAVILFETGGFRPWHSNMDYAFWASGGAWGFRQENERAWKDQGKSVLAFSYSGWRQTDRIEYWCPSFESYGGPAIRASTMVHEATHITFGDAGGGWEHDSHNQDHWYAHGVLDYGLGVLWPIDQLRHSMFQIQAEWLADIAEYGESWLPQAIVTEAWGYATTILGNNFRNTVPWTLGTPRPL